MKGKLLKMGLTMIAVAAIMIPIAMPAVVFAAARPINSNVFNPVTLAGPLLVCVGAAGPTTQYQTVPLFPVCQNVCDLIAQIANIIYYAIAAVIWIIAPILIAIGGVMIMLGGASPEMVGRGKKTITGAIWGIVIVLCSWLIVFTFISAFGSLGKSIGGFGQAACQMSPSGTTSNVIGN